MKVVVRVILYPVDHLITKISEAAIAATKPMVTAVALSGHSAAIVPIQWQRASLPPAKIVNSAPCSPTSACYFGGNIAAFAAFAAFFA